MDHDLGLRVIVLRECGAQGAVHEAHHQNFSVTWAGLTLEETSGETSGGGILLTVIDREGKEIHPFGGFLVADCSCKQHGVALTHHDTSVGLFGEFAGLNGDRTTIA